MKPELLRRYYRIGEVAALTVYADSRTALDAVGLVDSPEPVPGEARPEMALFILGRDTAVGFPSAPEGETETIIENGAVEVRKSGVLHYGTWFGKASSIYDPERGAAILLFPGVKRYHPDFAARSVCRPILDRMLLERGYLPFHGASASRYGRGCLITGASGSGKTTLLRGLLNHGWSFLSDDRAVAVVRNGAGELLRYPENIRTVVARGRKATCHPPHDTTFRASLRTILFLERSRGKFRVHAPGQAETAARLAQVFSPYLGAGERSRAADIAEYLAVTADSLVIRGCGEPDTRLKSVWEFLHDGSET